MNGGDIRLIFILVFVVIGIIRAIIKAANGENKVNQNPQMNPGRSRQVQSEIDDFLSEVGAAPHQKQPAARRRQRPQKQRPQQRRPQKEQRPQRQKPKPAAARQQPSGSLRDRHLKSSVSDHVTEYISDHVEEHIDSEVDDWVEVDIVENVEDNLGDRREEMPALTRNPVKVTPANSILDVLRSPEGVRQAILVNEVLSRPRALRK